MSTHRLVFYLSRERSLDQLLTNYYAAVHPSDRRTQEGRERLPAEIPLRPYSPLRRSPGTREVGEGLGDLLGQPRHGSYGDLGLAGWTAAAPGETDATG